MIPAGQSKPQYGSIVKPSQRVLNRSHPLASYLKFAVLLNEVGSSTVWDAVTGTYTLASVTSGYVNKIGAVCDVANRGFKADLPAALQLGWPMTLVVRTTTLGTPDAGGTEVFGMIHNDTVTSPYISFAIGFFGGGALPYVIQYNTGGSFVEIQSSRSAVAGETITLICRVTASTQDLFLNGQNIVTATNSLSNPTYGSPAKFIIGDCRAALSQNSNLIAHVGYLFNIALPNSAIQELSVNPFAMFEYPAPQRRTLFPVAAIPTVWKFRKSTIVYQIPTLQSYSDSFSQADENPLSSSGIWNTYSGQSNLKVVSHRVRYAGALSGFPPDGAETVNTNIPGADQYAQVTLTTWTPGATSDSKAGVILRASAPNTSTWYFLGSQKSAGNKSAIIKFTAGTPTTLASNNTDWTSGDVLSASVIADFLCLYKNGTQILSVHDSAITAAGRIGLLGWLNGGVEGDLEFTSFIGGDFPTSSAYTSPRKVDFTAVNFAVDTPTEGSSFTGSFLVAGWVYDNYDISTVEIFVDGVSAGFAAVNIGDRYDVSTAWDHSPTNILWGKNLNTTSYSTGARVITVKFTDVDGIIATSVNRNVTFT